MKTCLVIDDSRVIRKVARRLLEDLGYAVEEAEDGLMGLEACRTAMPDVILVDAIMPNMDGLAFMKALRREAIGALPAIVFCTTENEEMHAASARAAGSPVLVSITMTMSRRAGSSLSIRQTSVPHIPGSFRSRSTASGTNSWTWARPSSPVAAAKTWNPARSK